MYAHKPPTECEGHPSYEDRRLWDSCEQHGHDVANQAVRLLKKLPDAWHIYSPIVRAFGYLHDIGKLKEAFQYKLCNGIPPKGSPWVSSHTPAGVRITREIFGEKNLVPLLIASHHGRLPDFCDGLHDHYSNLFIKRSQNINDDIDEMRRICFDYYPFLADLIEEAKQVPVPDGKDADFIIRVLHACCTKGDHTASRKYKHSAASQLGKNIRPERKVERLQGTRSRKRFQRLLRIIESLPEQDPVDKYRRQWFEAALQASRSLEGRFFSLDLPTGGGKTLIGLAFCYAYALKHGLKRIFYVSPYLAIIDQNTEVIAKALGVSLAKNYKYILEHHSHGSISRKILDLVKQGKVEDVDIKFEKMDEEECRQPLVITTTVQIFETIFGNKIARGHKWLNFANSIFFFDEFHLLPFDLRKDTAEMLDKFQQLNAICVFSSATNTPWQKIYGTQVPVPIIKPKRLPKEFRRVRVNWKADIGVDNLCDELEKHKQVLCVVNTRRGAQHVFRLMQRRHPAAYCLTTLQYKEHRLKVIAECKERLVDGRPVLLISTQSVEAGVDIDFPVGYRQIAPLESLIQFCGRVNRHGKTATQSDVFVFELNDEIFKLTDGLYAKGVLSTRNIIEQSGSFDIYDEKMLRSYYRDVIDKHVRQSRKIKNPYCDWDNISLAQREWSFQSVADTYKLVKDQTQNVVAFANEDEEQSLRETGKVLSDENAEESLKEQARLLLRDHHVSLYDTQIETLLEKELLETLLDDIGVYIYCGRGDQAYSESVGIPIEVTFKETSVGLT